MTEDSDMTTEMKKLSDLDLQELADDFAEVLSKHLGGSFEAAISKLELTKAGLYSDGLIVNFLVHDRSRVERFFAFREKVGFFAEPETANNK